MKENPKELVRTRLAPTPSGYLHLGNLYNFVLTWWFTKKQGGNLHLRIDDFDSARCREEYLADIFRCLDVLELEYHSGPSGVEDFKKNYSQNLRREDFFQKFSRLKEKYACDCSRKDVLKLAKNGIYPGTCRHRNLSFRKGHSLIRFDLGGEKMVDLGARRIPLHLEWGDAVLWRRDDLPAYHWVSVWEDVELQITHLIRGADLLVSSAGQLCLAAALGVDFIRPAAMIHHPLLEMAGKKLSKSKGNGGGYELISKTGGRDEFFAKFAQFFHIPEVPTSLADLEQMDFPSFVKAGEN